MANIPILIGICGHPGSGKSTVQEILQDDHGIIAVDDGRIFREHCSELFGLEFADTLSQEGKAKFVEIQGKRWQIRDILGTYAWVLEETFGQQVAPEVAIKSCLRAWQNAADDVRPRGYSFGSVRRGQGLAYRQHGGLVFEVVRPDNSVSGYDFDQYDKSLVTHTIINDGSLADLRYKLAAVLTRANAETTIA